MTPYSDRCDILSDFWMNYRNDEAFDEFVQYNDLGLPLAYMISSGLVSSTPQAEELVNESFEMLLAVLELEDTGWDSLDDLLEASLP